MNLDRVPDEDALIASLTTSSPEWRRDAALRYSGPRARAALTSLRWWLAAAATLLLTAGAGIWWFVVRSSGPDRLLARAYTESRPFEYRLPDAGYSPIRVSRSAASSSFERPRALVRAVEQIQRKLAADGETGPYLLLRGRAELIETDYQDAIASLERSNQLQPGNAETLTDLACAYALRGDAEKHSADYGHAADLLAQSLRIDSTQLRAIFNLAVVYRNLGLLDDAIESWDRYLRLDPSGPWVQEARKAKAELERVRARKRSLMSLPRDPRGFLAQLRTAPADLDPELYVDEFWMHWLPAVHDDGDARAAADELGRILALRLHDQSVRNAVSEALAVNAVPELRQLGEMLSGSIPGSSDATLNSALKLVPVLEAKRQSTARLRAILELGYGYNRIGHLEDCLAVIRQGLQTAAELHYAWLSGYMTFQEITCATGNGNFAAAIGRAETLGQRARSEKLANLALKARTLAVSAAAGGGNPSLAWNLGAEGLARYWASASSDYRAQQLLHDLQTASAELGWREDSVILARATVRATQRATHDSGGTMEALNRVELSSWLDEAGQKGEAVRELDIADRLLDSASPGQTLNRARFESRLMRAEVDERGSHASDALRVLGDSLPPAGLATPEQQMRFYQALGIAQKAAGQIDRAEASLREAIRRHQAILCSLPGPLARLSSASRARESYRNLADLELTKRSDPEAALHVWNLYRSQLSGNTTMNDWISVVRPDTIVLVYAVLPSGIAAWCRRGNSLRGRVLQVRPEDVERDARTLTRMAASPHSNSQELTAVAERLRRVLLDPFHGEISANAPLLIDADQWLSLIPFSLLSGSSVLSPGTGNATALISGLLAAKRDPAEKPLSSSSRALIVSVSSGLAPGGDRLPALPLAQREGAQLAARIRNPVVLLDGAASSEAVARESAGIEIFHFAGHGWSDGGNGALILSPDSDTNSPRWLASAQVASQNWSHCRLAVLSACFSGAGEDQGPVNSDSLVRAFLAAGARQVIAARWSVDSAATESLMNEFYERLFAGAAPAAALAAARARIAATPGWEHPYFWAGFDLYGTQY
jgi:CHAT domain-containing protein/Flp pilus assembly protein TadD